MTHLNKKIKGYIAHSIYSLIIVLVFLFESSGLLRLRIGNANPELLVPIVIFAGVFFREYVGGIYGLFVGLLIDSTTAGIIGFNTITLIICGFLSGLIITYYFNNNITAAIVVNAVFTAFYYISRWIVFYVFKGDVTSGYALVNYIIPSAVYTMVLGMLVYGLLRVIFSGIQRKDRGLHD